MENYREHMLAQKGVEIIKAEIFTSESKITCSNSFIFYGKRKAYNALLSSEFNKTKMSKEYEYIKLFDITDNIDEWIDNEPMTSPFDVLLPSNKRFLYIIIDYGEIYTFCDTINIEKYNVSDIKERISKLFDRTIVFETYRDLKIHDPLMNQINLYDDTTIYNDTIDKIRCILLQ